MGGKGGVKGKAGDEGAWSTWARQGMGTLVRKTRVMMGLELGQSRSRKKWLLRGQQREERGRKMC
jgi:hypothetical protein